MGLAASLLAGLFLSAFTSATLLPGTSEAVLAGLVAAGSAPLLALVLVASVGNVLGSCVNWWLGKQAVRFGAKATGGDTPSARVARAQAFYHRYGYWSLLASWVPVIGDPLTVIAGLMREPFWRFVAIVAIAKTGRYAVLAAGLAAAGLQG